MATWQDFNGLNLITDPYKRSVAQSLLINELGPVSNGYQIVNATTGKSGWSFGGQQMDLSKSDEGLKLLKDIVTHQYGASYWTTSLENGLKTANNINSITADQQAAINTALSSDYGRAKIDANFVTAIDSITRYADKIEIELQKINPDLVLSSGEKLMLIDYNNQYGLSLDNTVSGSMLKKLQDKVAHSGDLTPESIKELFKTTTYEMLLNEISLYDLTGNLNLSKLYELEVKVFGNF